MSYKKRFILFSLALFYTLVRLSIVPVEGTSIKELENKLSYAVGRDRIVLLIELTKEYQTKEVVKSLIYAREGLDLLQKLPDLELYSKLQNQISRVYVSMGKYEEAFKAAQQAMESARKCDNKINYADALCYMGTSRRNQGLYDYSIRYTEEAIRIYNETQDMSRAFQAYNNLAITHFMKGESEKALEIFLKSLSIAEKSGEKANMAHAYNNIATLYYNLGRLDYVLVNYRKALALFKEMDNRISEGMTLANISATVLDKGNYDEALNYAQQALAIGIRTHSDKVVLQALTGMSQIYEIKQDLEGALAYTVKGLAIAERNREAKSLCDLSINAGRLNRKLGRPEAALAKTMHGLNVAKKIKLKSAMIHAYEELSEIYAFLKDYRSALECFREYKALNDSIYNEKNSKKIEELKTQFDMEKNEREIELLKKTEQLQQLTMVKQQRFTKTLAIISGLLLILGFTGYTLFRLKVKVNYALRKEIDNHKLTAQKLAESQDKYRTLAEKSMGGIYIIQDNVFRYVNTRFLTIFGYLREEIIGKNPLFLIHAEDVDRCVKFFDVKKVDIHDVNFDVPLGSTGSFRIYPQSEYTSFEFRGITRTRQVIHLESHGWEIIYEGKRASLGTILDITDRKRGEEELLKAKKMEAISVLAGGIAHDFNNLLTIITGYLSMVKDYITPKPGINHKLDTIERATSQATKLANKLISVSPSGGVLLEKTSFEDILKTTAQLQREIAPLISNVKVMKSLKPIRGNERQLSEVMANLLLNAMEAAVEPKKVFIHAENAVIDKLNAYSLPVGDYVKVSITDNGRGIPPEQLEKVFDPFFYASNPAERKRMSLGLAICHSIIKKHNGYISIHSEVGVGTTVEFYLPVFKADHKYGGGAERRNGIIPGMIVHEDDAKR